MRSNSFLRQAVLCTTLLILSIASSQLSYGQTSDISDKIRDNAKTSGSALLLTEKGEFKLYASYKNSKLTDVYAVTNDGKRIDGNFNREETSKNNDTVTCYVCLVVNGRSKCYKVFCDLVPPPMPKKPTR